MITDEPIGLDRDTVYREQAIKRLKKRRDFYGHLLVYALVNGFLVTIWMITGRHGFFWPIFPMAGWGIAVVLNAWDVYRSDTFTEEQIRREIDRLQRGGAIRG
jgi:2TM domain-containing protein